MKILSNNMYLLLIDEEAEIKENTNTFKEGFNGDWFWCSKYNSIQRIGNITEFDFKIIAYYPLTKEAKELESLPLLPNPFEPIIPNSGYEEGMFGYTDTEVIVAQNAFKEGYKAAQSKQFSLEDINKAIAFGFGICRKEDRAPFNLEINEFIQSLSTQQLPKEFILGEGNAIEEQIKNGYYI